MNISALILDKINTDRNFRLELAMAINLSERQIQNLVVSHKKGKSVRLRDAFAVEFFRSKGFTDAQIFECESRTERVGTH